MIDQEVWGPSDTLPRDMFGDSVYLYNEKCTCSNNPVTKDEAM